MTFKENPHRHQSDFLDFIPKDYFPYKKIDGQALYGVIFMEAETKKVKYQNELPKFGGYISDTENMYGSPTFCRNATRNHIKHIKQYGYMPHLIFFESEETAIACGFRKCKVCDKPTFFS